LSLHDALPIFGLSLHTSGMCDDINDWSKVFINNQNIGEIGGQESNTTIPCAGVIGSFYYENQTLHGIGNDNANPNMYNLDAIAQIESYISVDSINLKLVYNSTLSP